MDGVGAEGVGSRPVDEVDKNLQTREVRARWEIDFSGVDDRVGKESEGMGRNGKDGKEWLMCLWLCDVYDVGSRVS